MVAMSVILLAQIGFDDALVVVDVLWQAFGDLLPHVHDGNPVRDAHDDLHVMLDEQQRESLLDKGLQQDLSLIHISEPTRLGMISYAVFCLKKKKKNKQRRKIANKK